MKQTLREDALAVLQAAIDRVNPRLMVERALRLEDSLLTITTDQKSRQVDLSAFDRLLVVGAGKATASMARGVETVLADRIDHGVIAVKPGHVDQLQRITMMEAGHPVPNQGSVDAAAAILDLAATADERTLVLNLVSGGGSALLTRPYDDGTIRISLEDMQRTTAALLACGATIQEINCVRKHLSSIKGGRMAAAFAPARVISLILSDVVGDDLSSIASGITVPDPTSYRDVRGIFRKYGIEPELPAAVASLITLGEQGQIPDTPGPDDPVFTRVDNILIGSNAQALGAASTAAKRLGYNTVVLGSQITGEAREVARVYAGIARDLKRLSAPDPQLAARPACIIAGGETTVTIRGDGKGGRNQEMALAALAEFTGDPESLKDMLFLSGATDGNDGPTDAAGGFADHEALQAAVHGGLDLNDILARNDAYHGLEALDALVKTGPTNTNVCDIQVILVR